MEILNKMISDITYLSELTPHPDTKVASRCSNWVGG